MKKLKILFAVITVLSLLFTVASASDSYLKFGAATVEYTEGSDLTISVYASKAISYAAGYSFELTFDNTVWNYKSAAFNTSIATDGMVSGEDGTGRADALSVVITTGGNKEIAADTKIVDLTFEKVAGEAAGTKFVLDFDVFGGNFCTPSGDVMNFSGEIEVTAAATDEKVYENDAIAAVATEIVDGDTFYKNLAVFDTVISLDGTKTAKKVGMKLASSLSANTFDVENAIGTEVSGDGQVAYAFVVYNVPTGATVTATPFVVYGN